ncbi:MAG: hypothetical protein Q8Q67_01870 [bacterium]|nr:hypothetical protein [bacterium]
MKKMTLRPVELYFLLCFAKHEKWNTANAITAVLIELYERNLIVLTGANSNSFAVKLADVDDNDLRPYERVVLEALKSEDKELLYDAIDDFGFKKFLLKTGLLMKQNFSVPILFKSTVLSSAGTELVRLLLEDKSNMPKESPPALGVITVFPSIASNNALIAHFRNYANKAVLAAIKRHTKYSPELSPMHAFLL